MERVFQTNNFYKISIFSCSFLSGLQVSKRKVKAFLNRQNLYQKYD